MTDKMSTPPAAKRVRWDDSVPNGAEEPVPGISRSEAANPVSAQPSCNANDAIRLHSGENYRALMRAVRSSWVRLVLAVQHIALHVQQSCTNSRICTRMV